MASIMHRYELGYFDFSQLTYILLECYLTRWPIFRINSHPFNNRD